MCVDVDKLDRVWIMNSGVCIGILILLGQMMVMPISSRQYSNTNLTNNIVKMYLICGLLHTLTLRKTNFKHIYCIVPYI